MSKQIVELKKVRKEINQELEKLFQIQLEENRFRFKVTDHAVLRYLQRVDNSTVSEARFIIMDTLENFFISHPTIKLENIKTLAYDLRIKGIIYVINNNTVITVKNENDDNPIGS